MSNKLSIEFVVNAAARSMHGIFQNAGSVDIEIPAFTTYVVNSNTYYNATAILVPQGNAQVTVPLSAGDAHKRGSDVTLSTLSVDYNSGKEQLKSMLGAASVPWRAVLPTETGDTILSLISTVHASAQQNIIRSLQDVFPATAISDSAIYAGATMQGIRLNRKLPANMPVAITNPGSAEVAIPPYTVFSGANTYWFNRELIVVAPGATLEAHSLYQGVVKAVSLNGLGSPYQAWASPEDGFSVSDVDTFVHIGNESIPKVTTGLWSSKEGKGFVDKTLASGEFVVEFGDGTYGSAPKISDTVTVTYVVTSGSVANSLNALNKNITAAAYPGIRTVATQNPSGGADETSALRYKNIAAYSFGTFGSAVNKSQYLTTILEYPGIADAVTFAEREISQSDPRLMNYIQVTYLLKPGVTWDSVATTNFVNYLHDKCSYSCRFNIVPPLPNSVTVKASVYCKSWANLALAKTAATGALFKMFSNAGLNYDIMITDITSAILDSYAGIDYVDLILPTKDAVVSTPWIPAPVLTAGTGGAMPKGAVAYAVGYNSYSGAVVPGKNLAHVVLPQNRSSVTITWAPVAAADSYIVYGRGGSGNTWGILANAVQGQFFIDTGLTTPTPMQSAAGDLPVNQVQYNVLDTAGFDLRTYYSQRSAASSSKG